jgi:hypothetical protein
MGFVIFLSLLLLCRVYDGREHGSWGTGTEAPENFPDSVEADSSDFDADEERERST